MTVNRDSYLNVTLSTGKKVAVIGGGPYGAFGSIFPETHGASGDCFRGNA